MYRNSRYLTRRFRCFPGRVLALAIGGYGEDGAFDYLGVLFFDLLVVLGVLEGGLGIDGARR